MKNLHFWQGEFIASMLCFRMMCTATFVARKYGDLIDSGSHSVEALVTHVLIWLWNGCFRLQIEWRNVI